MVTEEMTYTVLIDPAANSRMYDHLEFLARVSESAAKMTIKVFYGRISEARQG